MKVKLLFLCFFCLTTIAESQVVWTGGGANVNWNTDENWSTSMVPGSTDDVEIPSGFTVTIEGVASCQSLELQGSAILNLDGGSLFSPQPSFFESGTTVNWADGSMNVSLLVNMGTMNLTSNEDKSFTSNSIINNNGTINIIGSGELFLQDNTVLNNEVNGTIDMRADDGDIDNIGGQSVINNEGIIRRSTTSGEAEIQSVEFNNNGGIIQVDSGTLGIIGSGDKNFTGGSYIVSAGTILDWDLITVSGFLMGTVEGDLNWNNSIEIPVSATFNFSGSGSINWIAGALTGGGVLTNESTINLIGGSGKSISDNTTLNNAGSLNLGGTIFSDLTLSGGSILNNLVGGIIDIQADGITIGGSAGVITNSGLIKRTTSTGESGLSFVDLDNTGGTIQVESGTLAFTQANSKSFTEGTINVFSGAEFTIDSPTPLSGTIEGVVDGDLIWESLISIATSATIDFTGNGNVNSTQNTIEGGGTLTNQGNFNITGVTSLEGGTTFNNTGTINLVNGSGLFIPNGTLNNEVLGVIDMNSNGSTSIGPGSGATLSVLNNAGLLKKTTSGNQLLSVDLVNTGTIDVETGELTMSQSGSRNFTNTATGVVKGSGIFNLPPVANYVNDGTFAPGASPGTLTVVGNYESTANAVLAIELDGLTQGTEYDLLAITGNADLNGELQVILNFEANINDQFIIATTTGNITNCNLPTTVSASIGNANYQFSVDCINGNELALNVTEATLSTTEKDLNRFKVYPNPTQGAIFVKSHEMSKISLFDINGRRVFETVKNELSIHHLENGVYLLELTFADGSQAVNKIVKF